MKLKIETLCHRRRNTRSCPHVKGVIMTQHLRPAIVLLAVLITVLAAPTQIHAQGSSRYELENSLTDRAKWRSFGVRDWVSDDPVERARAGRARIRAGELERIAGNTPTARLKSLIALAEAGPKGYDAAHIGGTVRPPAAPTQLTLAQIYGWIKATPGQPHAIGRYQFIPATLRQLVQRTGTPLSTRFSPKLQDQFADILLEDAGYSKFLSGGLSRKRFMNNLARIWAGLPNHQGKSHYDGYAGNRATITRAFFQRKMDEFFPA
jgi:hypothetical protein